MMFAVLVALMTVAALGVAIAVLKVLAGEQSSVPESAASPSGSRHPRRTVDETVDESGGGGHDAVVIGRRTRPEHAAVRGTMQPLHAEGFRDVIIVDGYVVLEETEPVLTRIQGPATLTLCQPVGTPVGARNAHRRLQQWIDEGTVVDVEIRHRDSGVELDVWDRTSTIHFDVASAR